MATNQATDAQSTLQPGDFASWSGADDDIPEGVVGKVQNYNESSGRFAVKFPKGIFNVFAKELVVWRLKPGDFVSWIGADDDIPEGVVGKVQNYNKSSGRFAVKFPKGIFNFFAKELVDCILKPGDFVSWTGADDGVPQGIVGNLQNYNESSGRFAVKFPKGIFNFFAKELVVWRLKPGDFVSWTGADDDIPEGVVGIVQNYIESSGRFAAKFPKGIFNFFAKELVVCILKPGELVSWTGADDDVPQGIVGKLQNYNKSSGRFAVKFPKGIFNFFAKELTQCPIKLGATVECEGATGTVSGLDSNGRFSVHFFGEFSASQLKQQDRTILTAPRRQREEDDEQAGPPLRRRRVVTGSGLCSSVPSGVDAHVWRQLPADARAWAMSDVGSPSWGSTGDASGSKDAPYAQSECIICMSAAAIATFVHGETGHTVCCMDCAKKVKDDSGLCPSCRLPIISIIQCYGI